MAHGCATRATRARRVAQEQLQQSIRKLRRDRGARRHSREHGIAVRDPKADPNGPTLTVTASQWRDFAANRIPRST